MTPEQWAKLKVAFGRAYDAGGVVDDLLAEDPDLRAELNSLLEADASAGEALESPPWAVLSRADLLGMAEVIGDEDAMLRPGQTAGGYIIEELIGSGGMGEVYRAEQARPRRKVALKVIRAGLSSRRAIKRLEAEAAILARLDHPNVARVIEAGVLPAVDGADASPFFSMELVAGVSIADYAREKQLDVTGKIDIMRQVCAGVEHAHQRGVIHRDLKPANILVDAEGRARVLDFGVARAIDRDEGATLVHAGFIPGTLAYMSPEQASGDAESVDTRGDVYALGVVLYELLAGRLPIEPKGRSAIEVLRAICEDEPPALGSIDRSLCGELEAIVTAALRKDPNQRYQSAGALGDDLSRFLRQEPISVRRPTAAYLVRLFAQRRRGTLIVTGALLLAALSLAGWQYDQAVSAERLATQRLAELRRALTELVTEVYPALWLREGKTETRMLLAEQAMNRLDELIGTSGDDPQTLWDLSTAVFNLGRSTGHPGQPNAGRRDEAVVLIGRALDIRTRVLATSPQSKEYLLGTAGVCFSLALITDDEADATALMDRALLLYESVCNDHPDDGDLWNKLAYVLAGDGWRRAMAGMPFAERFERARSICEELARKDPANTFWLGTHGSVMSMHAAAIGESDPAAAIEIYRAARSVLAEALAREPGEYSYVRHAASCDRAEAMDMARRGLVQPARELAEGVVATLRLWYAKDNTNSFYREELIEALLTAAEVRLARGACDVESARALAAEAKGMTVRSRPSSDLTREEAKLLAKADAILARLEREDEPPL